jgi:hypothetical protein
MHKVKKLGDINSKELNYIIGQEERVYMLIAESNAAFTEFLHVLPTFPFFLKFYQYIFIYAVYTYYTINNC